MKFFLMLPVILILTAPALSNLSSQLLAQSESRPADDLKPLPALNLQDMNGQPVPSDVFKGNIVIYDFWATWCGPCIKEIPTFNRLQEKYSAKGVKVVGVTLASGQIKEVKPFISRHGMKYTILMGDDDQTYDLNIMGFPTTYLVTRDGKVFRKYVGTSQGKAQQLEADIQKLLETNE